MFQTRDCLQDRLLNVLRQAGGDAVGIHGRIVQTFRLQKNIVAILAAEPDDLVLDRRAVTRPASSDLAGIDGRFVDVLANDRVRCLSRSGHPAVDLPVRQTGRQGAERLGFIVAGVGAQTVPVDRTPVQPWRRAGLQPAERQAETRKRLRQADRRGFPHPPGRGLTVTYMDDASQERPGSQHDRAAADPLTA